LYASKETCDRPNRSRISVDFLDPGPNAEMLFKFYLALHVSHAALHTLITKSNLNGKGKKERKKEKKETANFLFSLLHSHITILFLSLYLIFF
jgi:hypothetical protein